MEMVLLEMSWPDDTDTVFNIHTLKDKQLLNNSFGAIINQILSNHEYFFSCPLLFPGKTKSCNLTENTLVENNAAASHLILET